MTQENRETLTDLNSSAALEVGVNTAFLTFTAAKPIQMHRYSIMTVSGLAIPAILELKLRLFDNLTGTTTDVPDQNLIIGEDLPRGDGVSKEINGLILLPGDAVIVALAVGPGINVSGAIFFEYWELAFAGENIAKFRKSV